MVQKKKTTCKFAEMIFSPYKYPAIPCSPSIDMGTGNQQHRSVISLEKISPPFVVLAVVLTRVLDLFPAQLDPSHPSSLWSLDHPLHNVFALSIVNLVSADWESRENEGDI